MSGGYASRLSEYPDKGVCGLPEVIDTRRSRCSKVKQLADLIESAKNVVVLTGAGISTSAGIPDFRGPNGIWTIEKEEKNHGKGKGCSPGNKRRKLTTTSYLRETPRTLDNFSHAIPTTCHRAITKLVKVGKIDYCITQNVDGLHKRAGLTRNKHASVHGCCFTEKCETCRAEFFRDFEMENISFQPTGRRCTLCTGVLRDTLLDWEDPLPADDLDRAYKECQKPGALVLCLGTSLRIQPIGDLPLEADKFVIVNLQKTPHDERATLVIRGPVDEVMNELVVLLGYPSWHKEPEAPIERVWAPRAVYVGRVAAVAGPPSGATNQNRHNNICRIDNMKGLLCRAKEKGDAIDIAQAPPKVRSNSNDKSLPAARPPSANVQIGHGNMGRTNSNRDLSSSRKKKADAMDITLAPTNVKCYRYDNSSAGATLAGANIQNGLENLGIINKNTDLSSGGKKQEDAIEINESGDAEDERKETPNSSTGMDTRKSRARPNFRNFTPIV